MIAGVRYGWCCATRGRPSPAVNVAVDDSPSAPGLIGLEVLPADLQPGQVMKFIITIGLGDRPTLQAMVRWADAAGDHEAPYTLPLY